VFLSVERPEAPSHFAGLALVDPSQSPEFTFERFAEHLAERIAHVPRFRWKIYEPPFGIDRPYWIEDDAFDFSRHLRRVAVPEPADRTALAQLVAFLHAQPLDRTQPLWEAWWIEGLPSGRIGVLMKVHHSLMDGQSGVGLSAILMDITPEPTPRPLTDDVEADLDDPPRRPGLFEMGRTALSNNLRLPQAVAVHARRALAEGMSRSFDRERRPADAPPPVPRVGFNGRLSCQRKFAYASIPLGPLRDAKKHFDVKMNDVLLEIVASSLRRGLSRHGDLPADAIVALCPVSLRQEDDQSFGNQIASMPVSLATEIESLPRRIAAIHASAEAAKTRLAEGAFETLAALGECLVPGMLKWLTGVAHAVPSLIPLPANLVISNVRGLPVPMYLAGARVQEFYPLSMLQVANGMNVTAVSHEDQVDFGFLVDSNLVPDPWIYADGVHGAVRDLEAEVAGVSRRPARERTVSPGVLVGPDDRPSTRAGRPRARPESGDTFTTPPETPATDAFDADEAPVDLRMVIAGLGHVRAPREHVGKEVPPDPRDAGPAEP
jgi:WS/DGAT/MGAT family acyltransferase